MSDTLLTLLALHSGKQGALGSGEKSSCRSGRADVPPIKRPESSRNKIESATGVGIVESCKQRMPAWAGIPTSHPTGNLPGMPLAHHPDPEEVDCLLRNAELRDAIEPYLDESTLEIDFRSLPTPVENRFLESMLAWEQAPLEVIARWFHPPMSLQPACTLDDEQIHLRLWETIDGLFEKRIILDFTDHLSDRELYVLIRRDILPSAVKRVDLPDNYFHWDCSATDAEDATVWLTYYATEQEREQWSLEEGRDPPARQVPTYPRALPTAPV